MTNLEILQSLFRQFPAAMSPSRIEDISEEIYGRGYYFTVSFKGESIQVFIEKLSYREDDVVLSLVLPDGGRVVVSSEGMGDVYKFITDLHRQDEDRLLEKAIRVITKEDHRKD